MTNSPIDQGMILTDACAQVARSIARDLREMNRPSISREQVLDRFADYLFDDPSNWGIGADAINAATRSICSHPAIRPALRD